MGMDFWHTIFLIGAVQGAFLTLALMVKCRASALARRLVLLAAALTLMILAEVLEEALGEHKAHLVSYLNVSTELALGPLLYLIVRSLVAPEQRAGRRDWLHFLPLLGGLTLWSGTFLVLDGPVVPVNDVVFLDHFVAMKSSLLAAYFVAIYRVLRQARGRIAVGRRKIEASQLRAGLVLVAIVPVIIYAHLLAERWGADPGFGSDQLSALLLGLMIFLGTFTLVVKPEFFVRRSNRSGRPPTHDEASQLVRHLELERPWLDPSLDLGALAQALGAPENRLSMLINDQLHTTFYELLSSYRLDEFERLARDPTFNTRSVLDLAFEAGFNSKASFYRAFRARHRTTPARFRNAEGR